jgi:hypothetical protein
MYLDLQVWVEFEDGHEHWYVTGHCCTVNGSFTSSLGIDLQWMKTNSLVYIAKA